MMFEQYLLNLAHMWCEITGRTLVHLGGRAVADEKFFERMALGKSPDMLKFGEFIAFFCDGKNWPNSVIPSDVVDKLDCVENIISDVRAGSPYKSSRFIASVTTETILARCAAALVVRGGSARQLSLRATGTPDAIREMQRGKMPSAARLLNIADDLGVTVEWLCGRGAESIAA